MIKSTSFTRSAHTPGPWHVGLSENTAVYGGELHLCILPNPESTHGMLIADIETLPEADANARLIAATPDLLSNLKNLVVMAKSVSDNWDNGDLASAVRNLDRARTAAEITIGKGEGELK